MVLVLLPRRAEGREGAKSLGKFRANVRAGGKVQPQPASWSFFVWGFFIHATVIFQILKYTITIRGIGTMPLLF